MRLLFSSTTTKPQSQNQSTNNNTKNHSSNSCFHHVVEPKSRVFGFVILGDPFLSFLVCLRATFSFSSELLSPKYFQWQRGFSLLLSTTEIRRTISSAFFLPSCHLGPHFYESWLLVREYLSATYWPALRSALAQPKLGHRHILRESRVRQQ